MEPVPEDAISGPPDELIAMLNRLRRKCLVSSDHVEIATMREEENIKAVREAYKKEP